ncbi:hypothetical protein K438DRAFT_1964366 [Mycena galopus ATCC 62051]|nr:hypothetical protein K438DRAFT_1964366 [Mycena galopus ATCC 62051]
MLLTSDLSGRKTHRRAAASPSPIHRSSRIHPRPPLRSSSTIVVSRQGHVCHRKGLGSGVAASINRLVTLAFVAVQVPMACSPFRSPGHRSTPPPATASSRPAGGDRFTSVLLANIPGAAAAALGWIRTSRSSKFRGWDGTVAGASNGAVKGIGTRAFYLGARGVRARRGLAAEHVLPFVHYDDDLDRGLTLRPSRVLRSYLPTPFFPSLLTALDLRIANGHFQEEHPHYRIVGTRSCSSVLFCAEKRDEQCAVSVDCDGVHACVEIGERGRGQGRVKEERGPKKGHSEHAEERKPMSYQCALLSQLSASASSRRRPLDFSSPPPSYQAIDWRHGRGLPKKNPNVEIAGSTPAVVILP